jgi:hypothetical protein
VVNIDVSDEIGSLFPVVADAVDDEFVCSIVECMECNDAAGVDVTTVEVEPTDSSVLAPLTVVIVVLSVDRWKVEDKDEYSVELIRFSFVVDRELNKDSE